MNHTHLVLIPKVTFLKSIEKYHPIGLCNFTVGIRKEFQKRSSQSRGIAGDNQPIKGQQLVNFPNSKQESKSKEGLAHVQEGLLKISEQMEVKITRNRAKFLNCPEQPYKTVPHNRADRSHNWANCKDQQLGA